MRGKFAKKLLSLFLSLLMLVTLIPATAFAEETDSGSVKVYFSASYDDQYQVGEQTNKVMAFQEIEVPYFDLGDYGLSDFYFKSETYDSATQGGGTAETAYGYVTMLHLFIYATEVYYCGVDPSEAGKGYLYDQGILGTPVLAISGTSGSLFMQNFWNHGMNLNYYLNYEYPLASEGWGSTADQILLEDGDIVTLGGFTSYSFYGDSTAIFNYMMVGEDCVTTTVDVGEDFTLNLYRAGADSLSGSYSTVQTPVTYGPKVYYTTVDSLSSGNVTSWKLAGTADADGQLSIDADALGLKAGKYIFAMAGQYGLENTEDICSTPGGILVTVEGEEAVNHVPVLAEGVENTATAEIDAGSTYTLDLSEIFTDADNDELTYKVSVNGADAVSADVNYSYTAETAGEYTFVFTANDGKADSADTYTVTVTANEVVVATPFSVDVTPGSNGNSTWGYVSKITISGDNGGIKEYAWDGTYTLNVNLTDTTPDDAVISCTFTTAGLKKPSIVGDTSVTLVDGKGTINVTAKKGVSFYSDTYWTVNFFKNEAPVLAEGQENSTEAEIVANNNYELDLTPLFTDEDGDELTYQVKVNDGEYTSIEGTSYSHTEGLGGVYQLTFRAYDGMSYSSDTYTVNLTVKNSSTTYAVTVNTPEGTEPVFYVTAGVDENGQDALSDILDTSAEGTVYTVAVPENVSRISYRADGMGMSVEVSAENNTVDLRNVNFNVQSPAGVEILSDQASLAVSYDDYQAVGNGFCYLLAVRDGYTYTITPGSAISGIYSKNTMESQSVDAGSDDLTINVTLNFSAPKQITADSDATVQMFYQSKYYVLTELKPVMKVDNGDGTTTYTYNDTRSNGYGAGFSYRVSKEGCITKAGYYPSGTENAVVTWEGETDTPSTRNTYDASTTFGARGDDSVLVNVNGRNHLVLNEGETFRLRAFRIWEIIDSDTTNVMIEPDFTYEGYDKEMLTIVSANENMTNQVSGNASDNWVDITANKEGTTFLEVSYDALKIVTGYEAGSWGGAAGQPSNFTYNACDPDRTALIVVQVGNAATDVTFGIDCYSSNVDGNYYDESKAVAWDAEFDTLYFTGNSADMTLSPSVTSGAISEVAVSSDKGETWTVLNGTDGVYTAEIFAGNNIIRVTKADGTTAYQVVRGDKVTVTINNTTNPGENLKPGDTAEIVLNGVHFPTGKMSGIYNPGYGYGHRLTYTYNGETVQPSSTYQYNFISNARIKVTIPEDADSETYTLTDGYLSYNIMGSGPGTHRGLTDSGASVNTGASSSRYTKCIFPDITLNVELPDVAITAQPENCEGKADDTAVFTIETEGKVLSYQWQYKNANSTKWYNSVMEGADTKSISVPIKAFRDGQQYRCVVTGIAGGEEVQIISDAATMTVTKAAAVITSQPTDYTGKVGETANFTVAAEGENLTYQWQYKNANSTKWYNSGMTGANTETISVVISNARDGQQYRCVITDADGNELISDVVTLSVAASAITITSQPENYTGKVGETATFTVVAEGDGLSYQWYYKNANSSTWHASGMEGANTSSISVPVAMYRDGQQYRCEITDTEGNVVTSDAAVVSVVIAE